MHAACEREWSYFGIHIMILTVQQAELALQTFCLYHVRIYDYENFVPLKKRYPMGARCTVEIGKSLW